jgi:deoxycytidine triphosphate deaminase
VYLPDHEIVAEITEGRLGIDGWDPSLVQPASIDLRLGNRFLALVNDNAPLDPAQESGPWTRHELEPGQHITLFPGAFLLAHTWERIRMPAHLLGRLEGKSSLGRLGIRVHSTAGFVDPGFVGRITLEISTDVLRDVVLYPGMRIGQLSLARLSSPARVPYGSPSLGSHYQDQDWPTPSRSWERFTAGLPEEEPQECPAWPPG